MSEEARELLEHDEVRAIAAALISIAETLSGIEKSLDAVYLYLISDQEEEDDGQ